MKKEFADRRTGGIRMSHTCEFDKRPILSLAIMKSSDMN